MRLLTSRVSCILLAAACLAAPADVCFAQLVLASTAQRPGVLYCTADSGPLLCSDDAGQTWHDPAVFHGKYKKAWLLSQGSRTTAVPVQTEVKPSKKPDAIVPPPGPHELVLAVQINGKQSSDFARLLQMEDGKLYAPAELITQWRLQVPAGNTVTLGNQTYYSLDALNGVRWQINNAEQILALTVPASSFTPTVLNAHYGDIPEAERPSPGLFLNHQLVYSHLDRTSAMAGLFEGGFFSPLGVLTSRFVNTDFTSAIKPIP
jgi:outer membrane usher protein FimD/PapC